MKWSTSKVVRIARRLRTLCMGLWILAAVSIGHTQELIAPAEVPGETYFAAFPVTITVDGNFDDWNDIPYATVTTGPMPAPDPAHDGAVSFAAVADSQNLYVSFLVTDATIIAGTHGIQYWFEDSVELYINATGNPSLTEYVPGVAQITFPALNIGRPPEQFEFGGKGVETIATHAIAVSTENGYAIEAAIPLVTSVWNITPVDDGTIGFQVQLNGATRQDRDIKLSWSNRDQVTDQSSVNPSVFGELQFHQIRASLETPVPGAPPLEPTIVPEPTEPERPGDAFTVVGSTIYDPSGNEFVAKGVNVSGMNWVWSRPTVPDADLIVDCWAFNLVRVNSFLFTDEQPWPQVNVNNDLDAIVNTFTQRGIVVVFEAHDRIGSYYQGEDLAALVNWYIDLANRYKDNPYVWFDVMNEPGGLGHIDATSWIDLHRQIIRSIREVAGANNIIIVEGANGGQDAGDWSGSLIADANSAILSYADDVMNFDGKRYENIVFSIHPYDQWNMGDARMADFFDRVLARNLALVIGEYAVQTNADTRPAAQSVFNTAIPRRIGRIVWHWDGGDANDLTINTSRGGGWEIDNCESPTNLSWLGTQVWNDNHS